MALSWTTYRPSMGAGTFLLFAATFILWSFIIPDIPGQGSYPMSFLAAYFSTMIIFLIWFLGFRAEESSTKPFNGQNPLDQMSNDELKAWMTVLSGEIRRRGISVDEDEAEEKQGIKERS